MPSMKVLLPLITLIALALGAYFYLRPEKTAAQAGLSTVVEKADFVITVTATGELDAKNSVKIQGPQGMRAAGIYQTNISDLVPEGTILQAGDYVASLDRTELANKLSTVQTEIEKIQTQLEQAKIDTAIELRGLRDEIINLDFQKKEKLLNLDQSKYEPQSVIQQAQLDLERTERDYSQLLNKYELKQQQSIAKINEILALLRQNQMQFDMLTKLSDGFRITAPEDGMLIYARTWNGKKEPGSQISAWDPVVAELPDLTDMISKTYVNEVDISRVQAGQEATIEIDAFPEHQYSGQVIKVANIGEQLRGYDAKVFEVIIQINEVDSIMRPAMTTSNEIITDVYSDVLAIPLEALQADSLSYVFKRLKNKIIRQEVITGPTNDVQIMIAHGLAPGDEILLSAPADAADLDFAAIPDEVRRDVLRRQQEEQRRRQVQAMERKKAVSDMESPRRGAGGGGGVIIMN